MTIPETSRSCLVSLVERFRVCWEVWPEPLVVGTAVRQVGFALELYGTHEPGGEHPTPACSRCKPIFLALHAIADHVLPRDERASVYCVSSFDQTLHYPPVRQNRAEVVVTIRILHREGIDRPVDACEVRCLEEIKQRLKELGAPEGQWTPRKKNASRERCSSEESGHGENANVTMSAIGGR